MAKKTTDSKPSISRIMAEINKKSGDRVIGRMSSMESIEIPRIPTGVKVMDEALGGGFPRRRITELYGLPSGGKSLISMFVVREAIKAGLECVYIDAEDSFDPIWATKLGVDVDKLIVAQSSIGEDTLEMLCDLLPSEPGVIVLDSVAAMITRGEMEEKLEKAFMAPKARLMSKALAKINTLNKETAVIFINQLRSTMALYGNPTTTPGGRALGHYASVRIEVKKGKPIHEDDKKTKPIIGQIVNFKVTKNKTAPPFRLGAFKFYYDDARVEEPK